MYIHNTFHSIMSTLLTGFQCVIKKYIELHNKNIASIRYIKVSDIYFFDVIYDPNQIPIKLPTITKMVGSHNMYFQ